MKMKKIRKIASVRESFVMYWDLTNFNCDFKNFSKDYRVWLVNQRSRPHSILYKSALFLTREKLSKKNFHFNENSQAC